MEKDMGKTTQKRYVGNNHIVWKKHLEKVVLELPGLQSTRKMSKKL